jgi:hypothetical protein
MRSVRSWTAERFGRAPSSRRAISPHRESPISSLDRRNLHEFLGHGTWYRECTTVQGMMDKSDELRDRVEARKHELLSKYNDLKADSRHEAIELRSRLKARLDEAELHLKAGWDKVSAEARTKLDQWLERKDDRD